MVTRQELERAAEDALCGCGYPIMVRRSAGDWDALTIAQIILDEVEPLVRADERARIDEATAAGGVHWICHATARDRADRFREALVDARRHAGVDARIGQALRALIGSTRRRTYRVQELLALVDEATP